MTNAVFQIYTESGKLVELDGIHQILGRPPTWEVPVMLNPITQWTVDESVLVHDIRTCHRHCLAWRSGTLVRIYREMRQERSE